MLKKVLKVLQATALLWGAILIPVVIVFSYVKSNSKTDILRYIDSYLDSEATCLSKYVGLQLSDTNKDLEMLSNEMLSKVQKHEEDVSEILKDNPNIVALSVYNTQGKPILRSDKTEEEMLDVSDRLLADLKDKDVTFHFKQLDDGAVAIVYTMMRETSKPNDKIFLSVSMKWSQYENFLDRLQAGIYPRKFYIVSPDWIPAGCLHG